MKKKNEEQTNPVTNDFSIETVIAAATSRGLDYAGISECSLGFLIDYIITYNNSVCPEEYKDTERYATQRDFDNF